MLNITKNRIDTLLDINKYKSSAIFKNNNSYLVIRKVLLAFAIIGFIFLFLPSPKWDSICSPK